MKLYVIKDSKAQTYQGCYCAVNDAIMVRNFQNEFINGKLGIINQFPSDFALYSVGELNETTGDVTPKLEFVKNFTDFVGDKA